MRVIEENKRVKSQLLVERAVSWLHARRFAKNKPAEINVLLCNRDV